MQDRQEKYIHQFAVETVKNIKTALPHKVFGYSISRKKVSDKCRVALNKLEKSLDHDDDVALFLGFYDVLVDLHDMDSHSFSKSHICKEVALFLCQAMHSIIEKYSYMANILLGKENVYPDPGSKKHYETMNIKVLVNQVARINQVCLEWDFQMGEFKETIKKYQTFRSKMIQQSVLTLEAIVREKFVDQYILGLKEILESSEAIEVLKNHAGDLEMILGEYLYKRAHPYLHGISESEQFKATLSEPIGSPRFKETKSWECSKMLITSKVFVENITKSQIHDILNASEVKKFPAEFLYPFVKPLLKKVSSTYIHDQIKKCDPKSEDEKFWKKMLVQKGMKYFPQYCLFSHGTNIIPDVKCLVANKLVLSAFQ